MNTKLFIFLFLCLSCTISGSLELASNDDPVTMLVSTLDGYLTAVDAKTGREKWRYKESPIVESPHKVRQDFSFIPNPRNGELYLVADQHLSRLPFTIPQLVKTSPCKSSDGILYAGSKKDVWIAMNPESGVHEETVPPQNANSCPVGNPETIFIGRTEYKVTMIDTKKKEKQWNATFIDYSSHLLPVDHRYPYQHFHSVADGRLITVDADTRQVKWRKNFKSVVVNLYLLKGDGMHRIPSTSLLFNFIGIIKINPWSSS
ncbi:unnamed protein product [Bursaphelenchus xylophilus]|uniref:(pine wood nematode) hypothetical protein n=1 Tax=Bursaphelenchus xylophilus TaxID=6326 RepID=A0A1I7SSC9_BURXY|nr:unnamed protein product [Bursaphelenchus xylophilus]CAG9097713.1 unnamed protein product [Bursaphelenchus xylophilus]